MDGKQLTNLIEKYAEDIYIENLNLFVGQNILEDVFEELPKYGEKALFCTGVSAMKKLGFYDKFLDLFSEAGIEPVPYEGITPNPTVEEVEAGVRKAKEEEVDFVLGLGGGSVIDTAKGIAAGVYGDIWDFVKGKKEIVRALPIMAFSTTSGTGTHVDPYAVITNKESNEKRGFGSPNLIPSISGVEVEITRKMPSSLVAATGFDALAHSLESATKKNASKPTKKFAFKSIELIGNNLLDSYSSGEKLKPKLQMAYADTLAGFAIGLDPPHLPHAISHPITNRKPEVSHGAALAAITPKCFEVIGRKADPDLKKDLNKISGSFGEEDLISSLNSLANELDLVDGLPSFSEKEIDLIFSDVKRYRWSGVKSAPVNITESEVREIIQDALKR